MEHPAYADSWTFECMEDFMKSEDAMTFVADQCIYGLVTPGPFPDKEAMAAKKPTRFLSNSWRVLHELATRGDRSNKHQDLMRGRASKPAEYPDELCRAICRGIANQKRYDLSGRVCTGSSDSISLKPLCGQEGFQFPEHGDYSKRKPDGTAHELLVIDAPVEKAEMDRSVGKHTG